MYYTDAFVVIDIFETRVQENCPETYPEQATLAPVFCKLLEKDVKNWECFRHEFLSLLWVEQSSLGSFTDVENTCDVNS